jgi:HD-GYP domain-containing protein (c-di-GMP phosphodiesterase class II)
MTQLRTWFPDAGTPQALRRQIVSRLALAGILISLIAGAISYAIENRHIETSVFSMVLESAQHFNAPENRRHLAGDNGPDQSGLKRLLDDSPFLAIRILDPSGRLQAEAWKSAPADLRLRVAAHRQPLPEPGASHRDWLQSNGEEFVQVVIPLAETPGKPLAYLEGIFPIDARLRQEHDARAISSMLFALFSALVATGLLYPVLMGLMKQSLKLSSTLLDSNIELIGTLGSAIAKRDSDTDSHNYRVTLYATRLAEILGRPNEEVQDLIVGAFLHDIGKIGIPDAILLKPGHLTESEFLIMKQHVLLGQQIIANNQWLRKAATVISSHHEKYDGTGYPSGLRGEEIPLPARIFAIVDVFDALTSERPYKKAFPLEEAKRIVRDGCGKHFDPAIGNAFLKNADRLFDEIGTAPHDDLVARLRVIIGRHFEQSKYG